MTPTCLAAGVATPCYRRPDDLKRRLKALSEQSRPPDDVIVVVRADDEATKDAVAAAADGRLPVRQVLLVAARNAALDHCPRDVFSFVDDDTVPHQAWLERTVPHLADSPGRRRRQGPAR